MKTAISIPDKVFNKAEQLARRLGISRSELYSEALENYMNKRWPDSITDTMNRVLDEAETSRDPFVSTASHSVLEKTDW
jgi:metal-responsive CopG/Arc/MetJ family transcriptional regulator